MKKSKINFMIILLYSLLSINVNLKQIIFLQRQIRKFLSYKNNQSKLFYRPQSKPKNNYLFLNSTDGQINKTNDLIYSESQFNSGDNVQNLNENNEQNERQSMNGDDDSVLNNEIKYVENLRIQNAIYTGQVLNGKRHGRGTQIWDDGAKYEGDWENDKSNGYELNMKEIGKMINQMDMALFTIQMGMSIKDIGRIIELMEKVYI